MNLLQTIEAESIAAINKDIPDFRPGDTLRVGVKVVEGERTRVQNFEGVCIARSNRGMGSNFTVRKISFGEASSASSRSIRRTSRASRSSARASCAAPSSITCAAAPASAPASPSAATSATRADRSVSVRYKTVSEGAVRATCRPFSLCAVDSVS